MKFIDRFAGHGWTILPTLRHEIMGRSAPESETWKKELLDAQVGPVTLSGLYRREPGAKELVVVLHGLGGDVARSYCVGAARAAHEAGFSCLRLAMRGADEGGTDIHHAGLTSDVGEILGDAAFARYERIYLVGYSLGGHVALRAAIDEVEARLVAVAAICPPLDLAASQAAIDRAGRGVYRRHVINALKRHYVRIARAGLMPTPVERILQVRTLREWDALTVVPRFGFADVDAYYRRESVASHIEKLNIPALIVASKHDPMVPMRTLQGTLSRATGDVDVRWVRRGGHVFFPPATDLGLGDEPGVEVQIMGWFRSFH
ncbi:MAG: alpha/beta fold hydrolase [Bradymonadaceae bacterium]